MSSRERFVVHNEVPELSAWQRFGNWIRSFSLKSGGDPELVRLFGGGPSAAGVTVSERSAQGNSAFWAAPNLIGGTLAAVPFGVYKRQRDGGRERQYDQLHRVLNVQMNSEMNAVTGRTLIVRNSTIHGVSYAEIERSQVGGVAAIWPLLPGTVQPRRSVTGVLEYHVWGPTREVVLPAKDVLVVMGPGTEDGITPASPARTGKDSIGATLAADKYAAMFYGQGTSPTGVLAHPQRLGPDAVKNLRESMASRYEGIQNAHRFMVLEEGMTYSAVHEH
jgi:HK97 family phage portal protein